MNTTRNTALAFLAGAVAGGITAILFAPDRGAETRRKLGRRAATLYRRGAEVAEDAAAAVRETAGRQIRAVQSAVHDGRDAYRRELDRELGHAEGAKE